MDGPLDLLLDDAGRGIEIHVGAPLSPASQRLMDTLGVRVVVMSTIAGIARCNVGDCDWSHEGTAQECATAGEAHRAEEHPWIHPGREVTAISGEDALAALDAGVPQREILYPAEITETRLCAAPNCDRDAGARSFYCDICRADRDRRRAAELAQLETPEPASEPAPTEEEEPPVNTAIWTRELIIEAIHAHRREHGSLPTSGEWATGGDDHPSAGQVARVFGSWASGIEAAGYPRPVRGGSRLRPTPELDEAVASTHAAVRTAAEDAGEPTIATPVPEASWVVQTLGKTPDEIEGHADRLEWSGNALVARAGALRNIAAAMREAEKLEFPE